MDTFRLINLANSILRYVAWVEIGKEVKNIEDTYQIEVSSVWFGNQEEHKGSIKYRISSEQAKTKFDFDIKLHFRYVVGDKLIEAMGREWTPTNCPHIPNAILELEYE